MNKFMRIPLCVGPLGSCPLLVSPCEITRGAVTYEVIRYTMMRYTNQPVSFLARFDKKNYFIFRSQTPRYWNFLNDETPEKTN